MTFTEKKQDQILEKSWKILIVDDDQGIHDITRTVPRDLVFESRNLDFLSAYNQVEAENTLRENNDISVVLLDIVMDEYNSGLKLVRFIREVLGNALLRIILRTGHPGMAPPEQVIVDYDINDYELKTDLTALKLHTTVVASLRNYKDLMQLDIAISKQKRYKTGLSHLSDASGVLFGAGTPRELVNGLYRESRLFFGGDEDVFLSSFAALQDDSGFKVIAAHGKYEGSVSADPHKLIGKAGYESLQNLKKQNRNLLIHEGTVYLYEDSGRFRFLIIISNVPRLESRDRQLLDFFSSNVSIAFENIRLNLDISGTQEELITRLSEVVETRSHDTAQHVRRVGLLCELIARNFEMEEDSIHDLKLASTMHDIGKIGIPDEILLKPGVLTEEEFTTVKTHTEIGFRLLKTSSRPLFRIASIICLEHHERFDGSGYPSGIKGGDIHLNSRIVSICDVFDSITHGKLHRDPWTINKAADYLGEEKGRSFDPELVDIFIDNLESVIQIHHDYPD